MAHGGKRPGAGRKKGSLSSKTREITARAFEQGVTPLEVMLKAMTVHYNARRYDEAASVAKDAAPYVHPRLSAMQVTGKDGGPLRTQALSDDDVNSEIERELARLAAERAAVLPGPPEAAGEA